MVGGENVVVLARLQRPQPRDLEASGRARGHHFDVRGDLVVRFEQFVDTALVRDAATYVRHDPRLSGQNDEISSSARSGLPRPDAEQS